MAGDLTFCGEWTKGEDKIPSFEAIPSFSTSFSSSLLMVKFGVCFSTLFRFSLLLVQGLCIPASLSCVQQTIQYNYSEPQRVSESKDQIGACSTVHSPYIVITKSTNEVSIMHAIWKGKKTERL